MSEKKSIRTYRYSRPLPRILFKTAEAYEQYCIRLEERLKAIEVADRLKGKL